MLPCCPIPDVGRIRLPSETQEIHQQDAKRTWFRQGAWMRWEGVENGKDLLERAVGDGDIQSFTIKATYDVQLPRISGMRTAHAPSARLQQLKHPDGLQGQPRLIGRISLQMTIITVPAPSPCWQGNSICLGRTGSIQTRQNKTRPEAAGWGLQLEDDVRLQLKLPSLNPLEMSWIYQPIIEDSGRPPDNPEDATTHLTILLSRRSDFTGEQAWKWCCLDHQRPQKCRRKARLQVCG